MAEVTRGPWVANIPSDGRKPITVETGWLSEGLRVQIAQVEHRCVGRVKALRNARAIESLPQMLDALERLLPHYVQGGRANTSAVLSGHESAADIQALWLELDAVLRHALRAE